MATKLRKSPVKRETDVIEVFGKHRGKKIVIELLDTNEIKFRIKGTRQSATMHIAHAYTIAKIVELESIYRKAMEGYQANKKAGLRARKPKKPFLPTSSKYLKAIFG